ncbi:hypothetical protein FIBSPDRAFT_552104 [Athelia psychrophila]|uniref:Uncharacterized protein n=1 Tax=Athelia psychrophila TaxID=1759441 RepID=A0A166UWJ7_9AGAM|nr:hypothetical protein FIBSPDRAFT_552104 [Fibularhizoctonia sp. CBS 109695]
MEIVQKELELDEGKRWEAVLVGVDVWMNGEVHGIPFEFGFVDTHHPAGLPPGSLDMQLPTYDPAALAGILATHGHTGALLLPPRVMGPILKSIVTLTFVPPPVSDLAVPWSREPLASKDQAIQYPTRPHLRYLLYPPTLLAHHPGSDTAPNPNSESDNSALPDPAGAQFLLDSPLPPGPPPLSPPPSLSQRTLPSTHAPPPSSSSYTRGCDHTGSRSWGRRPWGCWSFLQDLGKMPCLMSSGSGSSSQGKGSKGEKGSGGKNELLQRRREKKTLGASRRLSVSGCPYTRRTASHHHRT